MHRARLIRLEGVEAPCLLLVPRDLLHRDQLPEEIEVDFGGEEAGAFPRGLHRFRLMPSSLEEDQPAYGEVFDE